jgi:hypothetical protein
MSIFLLAIKDRDTYGATYWMTRRHRREIFLSLLQFLFELANLG